MYNICFLLFVSRYQRSRNKIYLCKKQSKFYSSLIQNASFIQNETPRQNDRSAPTQSKIKFTTAKFKVKRIIPCVTSR